MAGSYPFSGPLLGPGWSAEIGAAWGIGPPGGHGGDTSGPGAMAVPRSKISLENLRPLRVSAMRAEQDTRSPRPSESSGGTDIKFLEI